MCSAKPSTPAKTRPQVAPNESDMLARAQDAAKRRMGYAATLRSGSPTITPQVTGKLQLGN